MLALDSANDLAKMINRSTTKDGLREALHCSTNEMGFQHFALMKHPGSADGRCAPMRLHNYPSEWEENYDRRRLGVCDPVHRASHRVPHGFRWRDLRTYVPIGDRDEEMLEEARTFGIADGWTTAANVPGEPCGSVTFATQVGRPFPEGMILYAQALGALAYQQARVIAGVSRAYDGLVITDRQVEVAKWVGHDKSDWEIAQILEIKPSTVTKHVRDLCTRFNVHKRTSLALRAVVAGYLCLSDFPAW